MKFPTKMAYTTESDICLFPFQYPFPFQDGGTCCDVTTAITVGTFYSEPYQPFSSFSCMATLPF